MTDFTRRVHVAPAGDPYATMVADAFVDYAHQVLRTNDRFALALTGGNSPRPVYTRLASSPHRDRVDWSRFDFFWGDERAVPPDHADSNFRMVNETLLTPLGVSTHQIHRMPAEESDLDHAAWNYEQLIRDTLPPDEGSIPTFDLILLGMGEDGHTASLFPQTQALQEEQRLVVANDVPQLHTRRLTMTFPLINAARAVWFLVTGANKARRLAGIIPPDSPMIYPCQRVSLPHVPVDWFLDAEASDIEGSLAS